MANTNKGEMMISLNVFRLKAQLEGKKERRYTIAEMSEKTGLHRNTVRGLLNGRTRRIDLDVLGSTLAFFQQEGLEVEVADLFKMDTQLAK